MQKANIVDVDAGKRSFVPSGCKRESREKLDQTIRKNYLMPCATLEELVTYFFDYKTSFFSPPTQSKI